MKRILLVQSLGFVVLVGGLLLWLQGGGVEAWGAGGMKGRRPEYPLLQAKIEKQYESSKARRARAEPMGDAEVKEFLQHTVLVNVALRDASLLDAIAEMNRLVSASVGAGKRCPKIRHCPSSLLFDKRGYPVEPAEEAIPNLKAREAKVDEITLRGLLRFVCKYSGSDFFIHRGDVYVGDARVIAVARSLFFDSGQLESVHLERVRADSLATALNRVIEADDSFGPKPRVSVVMTPKVRDALRAGEIFLPEVNLEKADAILCDLGEEIRTQTGGLLSFLRSGKIYYDPFEEVEISVRNAEGKDLFGDSPREPTIASMPAGFSVVLDPEQKFSVTLDENWNQPDDPEDPFD